MGPVLLYALFFPVPRRKTIVPGVAPAHPTVGCFLSPHADMPCARCRSPRRACSHDALECGGAREPLCRFHHGPLPPDRHYPGRVRVCAPPASYDSSRGSAGRAPLRFHVLVDPWYPPEKIHSSVLVNSRRASRLKSGAVWRGASSARAETCT